MEEEFFATIKFKNGEEIFSKVVATKENQKTFLLLFNPISIYEVRRNDEIKYKVESWLKTTSDDLILISMDEILTIIESDNEEMIDIHEEFVNRKSKLLSKRKRSNHYSNLSKSMGYISDINEAKLLLERLFQFLNRFNSL